MIFYHWMLLIRNCFGALFSHRDGMLQNNLMSFSQSQFVSLFFSFPSAQTREEHKCGILGRWFILLLCTHFQFLVGTCGPQWENRKLKSLNLIEISAWFSHKSEATPSNNEAIVRIISDQFLKCFSKSILQHYKKIISSLRRSPSGP